MKQVGDYSSGAFLAFLKDRLQGKSILIAGFGREGKSSLGWLKECLPLECIGIADQDPEAIPVEIRDPIRIFSGKDYLRDAASFDWVLRAPGIPDTALNSLPGNPVITSQSALFLSFFSPLCIGVTGTKGKSTTSVLIRDMLRESGKNAILAGNIGLPPFDAIECLKGKDDLFVLELSAHQLLDVDRGPAIGCILNLFEEHLDHFKTREAYFSAKWRIGEYQEAGDILVLNTSDPVIREGLQHHPCPGNIKAIPLLQDYKNSEILHFSSLPEAVGLSTTFLSYPAFRGSHIQQNALTAAFISFLAGVQTAGVEEALCRFQGLPHRLQYTGEWNGVHFYDDAIATVPQATLEALRSIVEANCLLLGGMDRGISYAPLIRYLLAHPLKHIFCSGPAGKRIQNELEQEGYMGKTHYEPGFALALNKALSLCTSGDTLLLSPAAPSYDEYKNFVEKGTFFQTKTGSLSTPCP